jgi:hypothetical protein
MKTQMVAAFAALVLLLTSSAGHAEQSIEQIYGVYCVQCHGLQRNGTGINVPSLSVKPRDHTDAKSMGDSSDEELTKAITEGGFGRQQVGADADLGARPVGRADQRLGQVSEAGLQMRDLNPARKSYQTTKRGRL